MQFRPPEPGDRRPKLTSLSAGLLAACLALKQVAGMLSVETIGRIRRELIPKGKSIKEIARDLKISRNTARKIRFCCSFATPA